MSRPGTAALLIAVTVALSMAPSSATATDACESLGPGDLFPGDGTPVLPDGPLRYRDRGQMPEADGDPTSGLLFVEVVDPEDGGFTRVYAVPAGGGRWSWDHDSWFTPAGARADALPPRAAAAARLAGELLVRRLEAAGCDGPPAGTLQAYRYGPVRGAPDAATPMDRPRRPAVESPWIPGTPWAAAGFGALLLALWAAGVRRRRTGGAPSGALWSLWGHGAAWAVIVALGCVTHHPGLDLSAASPLTSWVHMPLAQIPPWWRLVAASLVLAGLLWPAPGVSASGAASPPPHVRRSMWFQGALVVVLAAAALGLFALLRIRHEFFGDAEFFRRVLVEQDTPQNLSHRLYWVLWNLLADRTAATGPDAALDLMRGISAGAGLLYVSLLASRLLRGAPVGAIPRLPLVLALVLPGIQVFFFYPEVYGPALVGHLLLLMAWTRALGPDAAAPDQPSRVWAVLLLLLAFDLAVELHTVALVLGPAVAWVAVRGLFIAFEAPMEPHARRRLVGVLVLCGLVVARLLFVLVEWFASGPFVEVRLVGGGAGLTTPASAGWLVDRVSAAIWVALPALVLAPAALRRLADPAARSWRLPFALAAGFHLVYLALWRCDMGVCRDWDLFAASGLVWTWLAGLATAQLPPEHPARRLAPLAVGVGAACTLCFLLANAAVDGPIYP